MIFKKIASGLLMLRECLSMSVRNILKNKVRSFLTVLGILIGVAAVIALITTVTGFGSTLSAGFSGMGAGTVTVSVTGSDLKTGLNEADLEALASSSVTRGVTPSVSLRARVSRGSSYMTNIQVAGKNTFFFNESPDVLKRGRTLNPIDEENRSFVCMINSEIMDELFYGVNPVDEHIYIEGIPFTVVGIISDDATESISDMMSGSAEIFIPYTTAMKMNNASEVTALTVYLRDGVSSADAIPVLEEMLDAMFSYEEDTYTVTAMTSVEETMNDMLSMVSTLLAGIASIALVVGGIGIMNMMLTTVSERTSEIGLKKALGAIPWQIQAQFLTESFLLSLLGGLLGVLIGLLLSLIFCRVMEMTFVISYGAILLGVGFSAAVGIIFGWAPARKASKLNPIDALRAS